jgi:ATP-dependent DNA ligase
VRAVLRAILPPRSSSVLYVQHIVEKGRVLYAAACAQDLEGIVAKWAPAPYRALARPP